MTPAHVFALMLALDPRPPGHARAFAASIAWTVEHDAAPDGMGADLFAAHLVVYGYAEGRYCVGCKRGDGGRSGCTFGVMATGARAALLDRDPVACTRAAAAIMRESVKRCGDLRGYCGACYAKDGAPAARIARDRARAAVGLVDAVAMREAAP